MAIVVEGGEGILTVAAREQEEALLRAAAQLLDIERVARLHEQSRAVARHLPGGGGIELAVTGHEVLQLRGGGISRAHGGEGGLSLRHGTAVRADIGHHGHAVGVHLATDPDVGVDGARVDDGVHALIFGHVDEVAEHVHAHEATAQIAVRPQQHGGELPGGEGDELAAVVAERLGAGHGAVAVKIGEVLADLGADAL